MRYTVLIIIFSISLSKCSSVKNVEFDKNGIDAYKFLDLQTYPASITESMFWENDFELARIQFNENDDFNILMRDILKLKRIKKGLSENFDFAFLIKKDKKTDTIYASLNQDLFTIKKNGYFEYYKDEKGELKDVLRNYSSFFSDCW